MAPVKLTIACAAVALGVGFWGGWLLQTKGGETQTVIRPPLEVLTEEGELRVWGAWKVESGYVPAGTGAIEIRCFRQESLCIEAEANLLKHTEGQDLTAEARVYRISSWTDESVEASQIITDSDCVRRAITIQPSLKTASQTWISVGSCDADPGQAELVGDPF